MKTIKTRSTVHHIADIAVNKRSDPVYENKYDHGKIIVNPLVWLDQINYGRKDKSDRYHKCSMKKAVSIIQR